MIVCKDYPTSVDGVFATYLLNELVIRGTHDPEVGNKVWAEVGFPIDADWSEALPLYLMGTYYADPENPEQLSWTDYAYRPSYDTIPCLVLGNNWPDIPDYFLTVARSQVSTAGEVQAATKNRKDK